MREAPVVIDDVRREYNGEVLVAAEDKIPGVDKENKGPVRAHARAHWGSILHPPYPPERR